MRKINDTLILKITTKGRVKKIMENSIIGGEGVGSARVIFHIQFLFFFPNGIKINFRQGFFLCIGGVPP